METADRTIQTAAATNSILLSSGLVPPAEKDTPAYTPPESSGKHPAILDVDAPPPYEPPSLSESAPPPVPEKAPIPSPSMPPPSTPPALLSPSSRERASSSSSITHLPRSDGPYSHTLSPTELSLVSPEQAGSSQASSSQAGSSSGNA